MKKPAFPITLLCLSLLISCGKTTEINYQPVNPDATKEARDLLNYLYSIQGRYILSGQHNYDHELLRSTDSVKAINGKIPAIWGADFLGATNRQKLVDQAVIQHNQGNIITLMYHQVKPFDHDSLGFQRSVKGRVSDEEWQQIVTPGTPYHEMLLEKLDNVAGYLKQLQDKNIPVLWRPYHEMNGIWFWYGDRKGPEGFQKLWKIMYDRYVQHHQLNNLIWVWNANAPRDWENDQAYDYELYYPGNEYVDVLAADIYKNDYKQSHHDQLLDLGKGKLIAIGECGVLPTPKIIEQQTEWAWFMDWARFIWTANDPEDVKALYRSPKVLTLDEIKDR